MVEKKYQVWLSSLPGVGSLRYKALCKHFGNAKHVFNCTREELLSSRLIGEKTADTIIENRDIGKVDRYLRKVQENEIKVYTMDEEEYPYNLQNIFDPPPVLYVRGELKSSDNLAVGVVGSRKASEYGLKTAESLSEALASNGICIVSGLALGIDAAAHRGAIKANGRTIAVFGCGLSQVYPSSHTSLSKEIIKNGALVSEYPLGVKALPEHFPARNRIISGLSKGVLVVEAGLKSGSLISADFALEQGRDVFAVPGSIYSSNSKGTNNLIKNGAKLVDHVDDILEELNIEGVKASTAEKQVAIPIVCPEQHAIMECLKDSGCSVNMLVDNTGLSIMEIMTAVTILEIHGMIQQVDGKYYGSLSNTR